MGTVQHPHLTGSRRNVRDVAAWAAQGWLPVDDVDPPEPAVDVPADAVTYPADTETRWRRRK